MLKQRKRTRLRSIVGGTCVKLRVGEGGSEGLSAGLPGQVLKELRDARLLLVRIPPSCFLGVLHHWRHWGLSWWRLVQSLPYETARPANEAPVTALHLWRRRCTAAPNAQNRSTTHVPQPLLRWVRRLRATLAFADGDVALLTEQARGGVRQV